MMKYSIQKETKGTLYIFESDKLIDVKNGVVNRSSHPIEAHSVISKNDITQILDANGNSLYIPNIGYLDISHKILRDIYTNMMGFIKTNGMLSFLYVTAIDNIDVIE